MERYELPCEIVQDLLPGYIDGLANEVTAGSVKAHLETCSECRRMYENMTGSDAEPAAVEDSAEKAEIDFLKKSRKRQRRTVILSVCITAALLVVIAVLKIWVIGTKCSVDLVNYDIGTEDGMISFTANMLDPGKGISDVSYAEKDGVLNITLKTTSVSFAHTNSIDDYYIPEGEITEICLNGEVIWANGVEKIDDTVRRAWNARVKYFGDASGDLNLASILGVYDMFGGHASSEMKTGEQPYVWKFTPDDPIDGDALAAQMENYAALLIALVENLDEVEYFYQDVSGEARIVTVDTEQASAIAGSDIKTAVTSAADLQRLVNSLQEERAERYEDSRKAEWEDNYIALYITNETGDAVASLALTLSVNGEEVMRQDFCDAGGKEEIGDGEEIEFEMFAGDLDGFGTVDVLSFTLTVMDADGDAIGEVDFDVDPEADLTYTSSRDAFTEDLVLSGSAEKGYSCGP